MKKQQGSARVVIILTLIVALLGILGFIFWQNFMQSDHADTADRATKTDSSSQATGTKPTAVIADEDDYSFTVVDGFRESTKQMFEYTASLKSVKTYTNKEGDYFEVLVPYGDGGGVSADYFWSYKAGVSRLSLVKTERCKEGDFECTAGNNSVEGIISDYDGEHEYYLAFGNKTKDAIELDFVDNFISTFQFK